MPGVTDGRMDAGGRQGELRKFKSGKLNHPFNKLLYHNYFLSLGSGSSNLKVQYFGPVWAV